MGDEVNSFKNLVAITYLGILIIFGFLSIIASFIKFADP